MPFFVVDGMINSRFMESAAHRKEPVMGTWTVIQPDVTAMDGIGWNSLRREKNRQWIGQIRRQADIPLAIPVWWEESVQRGDGSRFWTALWEAGEPLPPAKRVGTTLNTITLLPNDSQVGVKLRLTELEKTLKPQKEAPYAGVVIDISQVETKKMLSMLDVLAPVQ